MEKFNIDEKDKNKINIQNIKKFLINFLLIEKNEEKNMIVNIVDDYFAEFENKTNKEENKLEKIELLNEELLLKFFDSWKLNMYNLLLDYYEIDKEDNFKEEMLNNPEKYGLNYEAYQIIKE